MSQEDNTLALTKAVAVLDVQNLQKVTSRITGKNSFPDPQGLKMVLTEYGFDVIHQFMALALPGRKTPDFIRRLRSTRENMLFAESVSARSDVSILAGYLKQDPDGVLLEKQVDVLCALEAAYTDIDCRTILLFSQDEDLQPAIERARLLGRRVIRVCFDAGYEYSGDRMWLGEESCATLMGVPPLASGWHLRRRLAIGLVSSPNVPIPGPWTVSHNIDGIGAVLAGPSSEPALLTGRSQMKGKTFDSLFCVGFEIGRNGFPHLLMSHVRRTHKIENLIQTQVTSRPNASMAIIGGTGASELKTYRIHLCPGGPVQGSVLLAASVETRRGRSLEYLSQEGPSVNPVIAGKPHIVEIEGPSPHSKKTHHPFVIARLLGEDKRRIRLIKAKSARINEGEIRAVWIVGQNKQGVVHALNLSPDLRYP